MAGDGAANRLAGNPQPVEIYHGGIWYSGELLGWQHTPDGRVTARVRCTVDGLRHSTWKDLAELRLPDPAHPPRREPFPAPLAPPVGAERAGAGGAADVDEADRTRPHSLLAALTSRPRPPAHAATPPAGPAAWTTAEGAVGGPAPTAPRPRPTPYRRTPRPAGDRLRDRDAEPAGGPRLSTV